MPVEQKEKGYLFLLDGNAWSRKQIGEQGDNETDNRTWWGIIANERLRRKWCKPGATAREFERDKQRCMNEAAKVAAAWGSPGNPFMIADDTSKCLQLEYGYEKDARSRNTFYFSPIIVSIPPNLIDFLCHFIY